jgi:uncharacterized protein (DUF58 family)
VGRALLIGLLGALLAAAAAAFGPLLLLLPGCALVLLAVVSAAWALLAGRGRLERRVAEARVVEDEPCAITLEARLLLPPPPGSELVEPLAAGPPRPVQWRRRHRLDTEVRFPRRGRHVLEPARLVVRDPLGVAARQVRSPRGEEVLVLPRIEPVRAARAGAAHALALARTSGQASEEGPRVDFDTLREARPEVPATRIHWPAVARTGTLIERSLLAPIERRPLVALDAASPTSPEALDSAVRAAASLCVALARAGGCHLLLPGERRPAHIDPALAAWPPLHVRLALVEEDEQLTVPARLGPVGALYWVTARSPEAALAGLPGGFARGANSARFLVTPGPAPKGSAFTVAGCHGRRVGRASRRAA